MREGGGQLIDSTRPESHRPGVRVRRLNAPHGDDAPNQLEAALAQGPAHPRHGPMDGHQRVRYPMPGMGRVGTRGPRGPARCLGCVLPVLELGSRAPNTGVTHPRLCPRHEGGPRQWGDRGPGENARPPHRHHRTAIIFRIKHGFGQIMLYLRQTCHPWGASENDILQVLILRLLKAKDFRKTHYEKLNTADVDLAC